MRDVFFELIERQYRYIARNVILNTLIRITND